MTLQFFKKLIQPTSLNEDVQRRQFILNILLLGAIFLVTIGVVFITIDSMHLDSAYRGLPLVVALILLGVLGSLFFLSKKGHPRAASSVLILLFFVFAGAMSVNWGVELVSSLLFYVMLIVMAGVLVHSRFAFFMTFMSGLLLSLLLYLQNHDISHPDLYWKIPEWGPAEISATIIIFLVIALVSWLSNREIDRSLKRARASEADLMRERDMLEIRVEERTRELQKVQMEKMTEVYKFAEFGRLSSGLFHDLINPLNAVSLRIEHMKDGGPDMQKIEEELTETMKATDRMKLFITSIKKQIARTEVPEYFSLNQEITEALQMLEYKARNKHIPLIFQASESLSTLGIPMKFNQALINVVSNAIDACEEKNNEEECPITIKLERSGDQAIVTVHDQGVGIPPHILPRIFDPFFTTKNPAAQDSGTGIGLSLTKRIIEENFHGTMSVTSAPGDTTFIITFPLVAHEPRTSYQKPSLDTLG